MMNILFSQAWIRAGKKCEFCGIVDPKATREGSALLELAVIDSKKEIGLNNTAILCKNCKYRFEDSSDSDVCNHIRGLRKEAAVVMVPEYSPEIKEILFKSTEFETHLENEVKAMNNKCCADINEATKAFHIETAIGNILKFYDVEYAPEKEGTVKVVRDEKFLIKRNENKIRNKRFDSRFHEVVTEYKVNIAQNLEDNVDQLKEYIRELSVREKKDNYFGVLTDGCRILFLSYEDGIWEQSIVRLFDSRSMKELIRVYLSLERKKFDPEQLVKDFSIDSENSPILRLANVLYFILEENKNIKFHDDWSKIFKLAGHNDNNNIAIKQRQEVLSNIFQASIDFLDEPKALFALQTSYCILLKLIAYKTLQMTVLNDGGLSFEDLEKLKPDALKTKLAYIENGEWFKQVNILNLLDKDFFSWYLEDSVWNANVAEALKLCIGVLKDYDVNRRIFEKETTHDMFNKLYQSIIPKEVRHSLGEYYTMNWLADSVLEGIFERTDSLTKEWRGLDPCCGSGTFVMRMINKVIEEYDEKPEMILNQVLERVVGLDINPLAVLTCSVNYFIAIAPYIDVHTLIDENKPIKIPVILGDAALTPSLTNINGVECVSYSFSNIDFSVPVSILSNSFDVEKINFFVKDCNVDKVKEQFILGERRYSDEELAILDDFINNLMLIVSVTDNRIWVKTLLSILKSEDLGQFDIIISNPPWIDWKVLPDEYRNVLKAACIKKHVFSGDNYTGGINLNICALIANVVADNWLKEDGYMGLLMPKSIAYQQSYKGFRNLKMSKGGFLSFESFVDWSGAGNPFYPVTENFMTYYFRKSCDDMQSSNIICKYVFKKRGVGLTNVRSYSEAEEWFEVNEGYAIIVDKELKNFLFVGDDNDLDKIMSYEKIVGSSCYSGRVGLGLYPKGSVLFEYERKINDDFVQVRNNEGTKAQKESIYEPQPLESKMLYPVIEGPNIKRFEITDIKYYAPFPYTSENIKSPILPTDLERIAPKLYRYYNAISGVLEKTDRNKMLLRSKDIPYSITRVGKYTFAPFKVAFRNNTKWVAAVVSKKTTHWGEEKMCLFLDHACSVSQREDGTYITEDEAHYICAILNSNLVTSYIENSSDSRSFKTIFPIKIVQYDECNEVHKELAKISKGAHAKELQGEELDKELDSLMLKYVDEL